MAEGSRELKNKGKLFMTEVQKVVGEISGTLSTITVLVKLSLEQDFKWDLRRILSEFHNDEIQGFVEDVTGCKDTIVTSAKKPFQNSIVFKTKGVPVDDGYVLDKQSVKIFCNGNMHITGVKDVRDALYLADVFATMIEIIYGYNGISGIFAIRSYDVQLMNFYLMIPSNNGSFLNLRRIKDVLQASTPYYVSYNTERHAAVIVKAVEFTLLIFDSCNLLISSIKTVEQLENARSFIQQHVFTLVDIEGCCIATSNNFSISRKKRKADEKFDYSKYVVLK